MVDDAELVTRARDGDREAFGELVSKYIRLAGSLAYSVVGDFDVARDVVQESFLKAHRSLGGLKEPRKFKGWLYGVVRSAAIDHIRRERARPASSLEGEHEVRAPGGEYGPEHEVQQTEVRERVRREIHGLPDNYRELVILKYLEGSTYEQIAEITGLTVEAIESRLHRARKMLRKKLKGLEGP